MKHRILLLTGFLFSLSAIAQNTDEVGRLYAQKEYNKVIDSGLEILKRNPDQLEINMLVGRAYTELKQFESAIPYLLKSTAIENNKDWVRAWSYGYLGWCYYALNDYLKSKESLSTCLKLNATANATKYATKFQEACQLSDFYDSWKTVETENIRFHFQNPDDDKEGFTRDREMAFIEINKFFHAKPYKKIDFFVWNNPQQAAEKLGKNLGFANSDVCVINSRNDQTKGHEIAHILSAYGIYPTHKTSLINEGIASYFDQTNRNRLTTAKEALAGKDMNIIDLWENPKNYTEDYNYSIGAAWITYLFEKGTEKQIRELLKDQRVSAARIIYPNFDSLASNFNAMLR